MNITEKIEALKEMDTNIRNISDESAWEWWAEEGVPDCATEEDYYFIANEDFEEVADLYATIMTQYGEF